MSTKLLTGWFAAAVFAATVATSAQTPPQQPSEKASDSQKSAAVTITGCVQKETDVLKRPAVATNIGMGDEFVITNTTMGPATTTAEPPAATPEPKAEGTSGKTNFGRVYRLTGDKEDSLKTYVGKRVEITGSFKHDADARAAAPASGV